MILFNYLTDFNYFPLKIVFWKLLDMVRTGKKKWPFWKGVLISAILFSNQDHPCYLNITSDIINLYTSHCIFFTSSIVCKGSQTVNLNLEIIEIQYILKLTIFIFYFCVFLFLFICMFKHVYLSLVL